MDIRQLLVDAYGRVIEGLEGMLTGLDRKDLDVLPKPDSNSIGWLAWHITRVQDDHVADLVGAEQLYLRDGWHAKFDRPANPDDIGTGHSSEQVAAFRSPDIETFLAYHRAVHERTLAYINQLSDADFDRELNEPQWQPLPTVGVRLVSVLGDNFAHLGQIGYVRGLLQGKGWQPF